MGVSLDEKVEEEPEVIVDDDEGLEQEQKSEDKIKVEEEHTEL